MPTRPKHNNTQAQIWWTKARMGWKGAEDLNIGGTGTPMAIDFRWADALPIAPTIEHEPQQLEVTFETRSGDGLFDDTCMLRNPHHQCIYCERVR